MKVDVITAEQEEPAGEAGADTVKNSPHKKERGRPRDSKNKKVSAVGLIQDSANSNDSSGWGRDRPKICKAQPAEQMGSGEEHTESPVTPQRGRGRSKGPKNQTTSDGGAKTELSLKRSGRPKKSEKPVAQGLPSGSSDAPRRGRPKTPMKRKSESLTSGEEDEGSSVTPRKRGRPKGARNKKWRMERECSERDAEAYRSQMSLKPLRSRPRKPVVKYGIEASKTTSKKLQGVRGRPRENSDGSQPATRRRGRPKGSLNKKPSSFKAHSDNPKISSFPAKERKSGRPRLQPGKRGRPRKCPLPSPEELKKPKVWKPLGRPRKYPRVDPPEEAPPAPRRARGRPRKSDSKKGAHLRKNALTATSSPRAATDGSQRKRVRSPTTPRSDDGSVQKRGRPKGSLGKNTAGGGSLVPKHSKAKSDCPGAPEANPMMDAEETDRGFDISEEA